VTWILVQVVVAGISGYLGFVIGRAFAEIERER
jgi:hypothetical protein